MSGEPTISTHAPDNLPIGTIEVGVHSESDTLPTLEAYAHEKYALLSSEALRFIASQHADVAEQIATLDRVIDLAKARYPKEGDWIVINKEKVLAVLTS